MEIIKLEVGYLQENCYILKKNHQCLIVDPGSEFKKIDELSNYNQSYLNVTVQHICHLYHIPILG